LVRLCFWLFLAIPVEPLVAAPIDTTVCAHCNPCDDSLVGVLKFESPLALSEDERNYMKIRRRQCALYTRNTRSSSDSAQSKVNGAGKPEYIPEKAFRFRVSVDPAGMIFDNAYEIGCEYFLPGGSTIGAFPELMFCKYSNRLGISAEYRYFFPAPLLRACYVGARVGTPAMKLEYKEVTNGEVTRSETDAVSAFSVSGGGGFASQFRFGLCVGASLFVAYVTPISSPSSSFQAIMNQEDLSYNQISPIMVIIKGQIGWAF
jgi:hypothetical protein